jgi:hypothetical protein
MTTIIAYADATAFNTDEYIMLCLATCLYKEDGEVDQIEVIEPIPSAALEAICKQITTS